jgi:outer membrane receptor protein involved in Fe transport
MRSNGKLLILLLIVFFVQALLAFDITGTVRDAKTSQVLPGAQILIKGSQRGGVCDSDGKFAIAGLTAGRYELSVSIIGYESKTVKINADPGLRAELDVRLSPTLLSMQPVQVTGKSYRNAIAEPDLKSEALAVTTSIIPRVQIEQNHSQTLVDALNFIPGAMTETRGRKVKQFLSFRGQRYPYPDYVIDGVWQKEFLELPYFFSAQDVESIEVVRSSAILLTGISNMAGVVQVKTKEYEERETSCRLEYGTFNSLRGHLSYGDKKNTVSYAGGLEYSRSDGPEGKHAAERVTNLFGKVGWQPAHSLRLQSSAYYIFSDRQFTLAEPPADPRYWQVLEEYDPVKALLVTFSGKYTAGNRATTEIKASYADRKPAYKSFNTLTGEKNRYTEQDHELNLSAIQAISLIRDNTLRLAFFYNHWVAPNGKRFYYGKPCDTETYSGVVTDEHQFGRLYLDAGVRWEKTHLNRYGAFSINESTKGLTTVTPILDTWQHPIMMSTIGAVFYITESVSLNLHSALGKVEPRTGTLTTNLAVPQQETQLKADLGIQKFTPGFGRLSLVYFLTRQDDAIVLSGTTKTMNGRVMELYLNRDQYQVGVEAEWQSPALWRHVRTFINTTRLVAKADQKGIMVRNEEYPQWIASTGILAQYSRFSVNVLTKYLSDFKSSQFLPTVAGKTMEPQPLGDFVNLDAILGFDIIPRQKLQFFVEVRNITDKKYATSIGYPDFGRRISSGINSSW